MTSGKSITASTFAKLIDIIKRIDIMPKQFTREETIEKFRQVWGDQYDYSLITDDNYVNTSTHVPIVCRKHGMWMQTPHDHFSGAGCPICAIERRKRIILNHGICDVLGIKKKGVVTVSYKVWRSMIERCYSNKYQERQPTYVGCEVCNEWLYFSNFAEWFEENYVDGYALDKDILIKGNKVYSPQTCCFVPQEINKLLLKHDRKRGEYPIGIHKDRNNYVVLLSRYGKQEYLGTFKTPEEAFYAYKVAKEAYIKEVATKYYNDGKIARNVYEALMNYKVEITD